MSNQVCLRVEAFCSSTQNHLKPVVKDVRLYSHGNVGFLSLIDSHPPYIIFQSDQTEKNDVSSPVVEQTVKPISSSGKGKGKAEDAMDEGDEEEEEEEDDDEEEEDDDDEEMVSICAVVRWLLFRLFHGSPYQNLCIIAHLSV